MRRFNLKKIQKPSKLNYVHSYFRVSKEGYSYLKVVDILKSKMKIICKILLTVPRWNWQNLKFWKWKGSFLHLNLARSIRTRKPKVWFGANERCLVSGQTGRLHRPIDSISSLLKLFWTQLSPVGEESKTIVYDLGAFAVINHKHLFTYNG